MDEMVVTKYFLWDFQIEILYRFHIGWLALKEVKLDKADIIDSSDRFSCFLAIFFFEY
jgi:hypothetical protein